MSTLSVGDKYTSKNTDFLRDHGIPFGVDFILSNVDGDNVSLHMVYLHGKICPSQITISKEYFGGNFSGDPLAINQPSYKEAKHYFPEVNANGIPIFPSPRYSKDKLSTKK